MVVEFVGRAGQFLALLFCSFGCCCFCLPLLLVVFVVPALRVFRVRIVFLTLVMIDSRVVILVRSSPTMHCRLVTTWWVQKIESRMCAISIRYWLVSAFAKERGWLLVGVSSMLVSSWAVPRELGSAISSMFSGKLIGMASFHPDSPVLSGESGMILSGSAVSWVGGAGVVGFVRGGGGVGLGSLAEVGSAGGGRSEPSAPCGLKQVIVLPSALMACLKYSL